MSDDTKEASRAELYADIRHLMAENESLRAALMATNKGVVKMEHPKPLSPEHREELLDRASNAHRHVPGGPDAPVYPSDVLSALAAEEYWRERCVRLSTPDVTEMQERLDAWLKAHPSADLELSYGIEGDVFRYEVRVR